MELGLCTGTSFWPIKGPYRTGEITRTCIGVGVVGSLTIQSIIHAAVNSSKYERATIRTHEVPRYHRPGMGIVLLSYTQNTIVLPILSNCSRWHGTRFPEVSRGGHQITQNRFNIDVREDPEPGGPVHCIQNAQDAHDGVYRR